MAGKGCIMFLKRRWLILALATAALAAGTALLLRRPASPAAALRAYPEGLTQCDVTLRLDEEDHTLAVSETFLYRNDTGDSLDHLVLRTWLNAFETEETSPAALEENWDGCYIAGFSPGYLTVFDVIWRGERAQYAYVNADRTALRVEIPPLEDGEEGTLLIRCVAQLPLCAYRTGYTGRTYRLGNVIPVLSLYRDGQWRTEEYAPIGDPFVSGCADYTLTLHAPEGLTPACSAPLEKGEDGAWRGSIRAARDLALCLSDGYVRAEKTVRGVKVLSYADSREGAERALDCVCRAVETFMDLYGPAPYPALSVCETDMPFGGMEYPGLMMLGRRNYLESRADTLELTAAHETAHQWFYALVGSDSYYAPWQDEGICEYAMLRYVRARYGQGSWETLKAARVDAPMQENVPGSLTPGSPVDYFPDYAAYASVVYGRGAALLLALDRWLPEGADGFLRAYADKFAYGFASRADFEEFLSRYAGMDAGPLLLDYLDTAH
ncbi:MAG: M1 family metallopeptidase [Clostridia bacterium]|nr:M1 family metallopeptidase [Clostridia bacterium]